MERWSKNRSQLEQLREQFDMLVNGIDNYPDNGHPSLIVANHQGIIDVFSIPAAFVDKDDVHPVISSRSVWGISTPDKRSKRAAIERYLEALPIECTIEGGNYRRDIGIRAARLALQNLESVLIMPEGGYERDGMVHKGFTGAARIILGAATDDVTPNLVPVAVNNVDIANIDRDNFDPRRAGCIDITVGQPIDYAKQLSDYRQFEGDHSRRLEIMRGLTKVAMLGIAGLLGAKYDDSYIKLKNKKTHILEDGSEIPNAEFDHLYGVPPVMSRA